MKNKKIKKTKKKESKDLKNKKDKTAKIKIPTGQEGKGIFNPATWSDSRGRAPEDSTQLKEIKMPAKKFSKKEKLKSSFQGITKKIIIINFLASLIIGFLVLISAKKWITAAITFLAIIVLLFVYSIIKIKLKETARINKIESVFPDFLQLMSSNLRAGITTDQALLLSARKEFNPLDKEIMKVGKELVTGRKIEDSLSDMANRINSEKIKKTTNLLVSGIRSGGNLAILLEETSSNMRERNFVEKKAASNVLMYVIFIFAATAVGAPILFALSSVLVQILSEILATIPNVDAGAARLPFTLTKISVSTTFITYFSLIFLVTTDILGSLVIGLVRKGEEKEGMKYAIPLIAISVIMFFILRIILLNYFSGIF